MRIVLRVLITGTFLSIVLSAQVPSRNPDPSAGKAAKVRNDESHCLISSEVRGAADQPISCGCRDALSNLRAEHSASISEQAAKQCGSADLVERVIEGGAVWNGPEVSRRYPPDKSIQLIRPDHAGVRSVPYEVRLTYRDDQGRVTKRESFRAVEKIGADFPDPACTPAATCLKGNQ